MKKIKIFYRKEVIKFLKKNKDILTEEKLDNLILDFVRKYFYNKNINIDFKNLKNFWNKWEKFFRIRHWKIRIIFSIKNWDIFLADVKNIDFRWWVYKK